jgi:hypothetical protein
MRMLTSLIAATNLPRLPWVGPVSRPYEPAKEWYHFCVVSPNLELIVNFNLGRAPPPAQQGVPVARLIVLARHDRWEGGVETVPDGQSTISSGRIHLMFGESHLRFEAGVFHLSVRMKEQPIAAELQLEPLAMPLRSSEARLGDGTLNWVVVPALRAKGAVRLGDRVYRLDGAPAYHDHNWGAWRWGSDFAWQWGFGLPSRENVWSVVYSRMTDRTRTQDFDRKLCLWREGRLARLFSERDVEIRLEGFLRLASIRKFPSVMALAAPGDSTDVPRTLHVTARSNGDHLSLRFHAEDVAQIVIPNEIDLGVTAISEVCGRLELKGYVQGESISSEGTGVFEHVHPG